MTAAEIIDQMRIERDRITTVLTAISDTCVLRDKAQETGISEAAEFIALTALIKAEESLVGLVLEPGLSAYLTAVRDGLTNSLRLANAAEGVS